MSARIALHDWQPSASHSFSFVGRELDRASGQVTLRYDLDGIGLEERIMLPLASAPNLAAPDLHREAAIEAALNLLHWTAAVSYWKAGCPDQLCFHSDRPDAWQADWLNRLYRSGLAEFAFRNQLDPDTWPLFDGGGELNPMAGSAGLSRRSLVPMGGGKDSLVAWSRLDQAGDQPDSVQIGGSTLIRQLGATIPGRHLEIGRQLDPGLADLNSRGAWNGHVPVTAINAAVLALTALVFDFDRVAFANERSADEASLVDEKGRQVNHQFSKSFEFELMFDQWVRRYIASDLRVFSILRRDRELAICRDFASLTQFHGLFSSCNRNFHLDGPRTRRWCGECPKCHFVFLCLAPFMGSEQLVTIFGRDLLAEPDQIDGFAQLLALDGIKPFECVGEADEARASILALAQDPAWSKHCVVEALRPRLDGLAVPTLESLCKPDGPSLIPKDWQHAA